MGIHSWDPDAGLSLFRSIGDRRTMRPTPCQGSAMNDEGTAPVVPEEDETGLTGTEKMRRRDMAGIDDLSDRDLITGLHLSNPIRRNAYEFELQRRFVKRLTKAMAGGKTAAWALVVITFGLAVATIMLVIATFRLASG